MLPQSNIDLSNGIVFQDQPSLTWIADPVTNRLRGGGQLGGGPAGGGGHRQRGAVQVANIHAQFRHGL